VVTTIIAVEPPASVAEFWRNAWLRGTTLLTLGAPTAGDYNHPDTGLPFSRGFVIGADQTVVMPFSAYEPQNVIDLMHELLVDIPLHGDVNGDGQVGFGDILAIIGAWGPCPGCPEDLDGNGVVGFSDVLIVIANWSA
jgi:hypothetical protein